MGKKIFGKSLKVGRLSLVDILIAGAGKVAGEKLFAPIVGNGTMASGLAKGAAAVAGTMLIKNRTINTLAMGVGVDAVEDILRAVTSGGSLSKSFIGATDSVVRV